MAELITETYRDEQKALHAVGNYGTASLAFGGVVSDLIDKLNIQTVLDYGCGSKRSLLTVLQVDHDVRYQGYDPAVPGADKKDPAGLVVCIDVLEHIEPELLGNVLDDLQSLTNEWAFFTIHTGPANKILRDGRNAHLIQQPSSWWLPLLFKRWALHTFQKTPNGFNVLLKA